MSLESYGDGWSRIWGLPLGAIYLLPSETASVIIQYAPKIMISAVLPPKARTITVERENHFAETEITTPYLLLSQLFHENEYDRNSYKSRKIAITHLQACRCHECQPNRSQEDLNTIFYINAVIGDTQNPEYAGFGPYRIGNVYESDGRICWGSSKEDGYPRNLRQANNKFWAAAFNKDLLSNNPEIHHQRCLTKTHYYGSCFLDSKKQDSKKQIRKGSQHHMQTCRRQVRHKCSCNSTTHKTECSCYQYCNCRCECSCCMRSCNCRCHCRCCQNTCGCGCRCNLAIDLTQHLHRLNSKVKTPASWAPTQETLSLSHGGFPLLGNNLEVCNEAPTGVFVSSNKTLKTELGIDNHIIGKAYKESNKWRIKILDWGKKKTHTITLVDRQLLLA